MNAKAFILLCYLTIVSIAELVLTYDSVSLGLSIYVILMLVLVGYSSLHTMYRDKLKNGVWEKHLLFSRILKPSPDGKKINLFIKELDETKTSENNFIGVLKCLTLAPLIRIMSVSMPLSSLEQVNWYLLINLPLFAVVFLLLRSQSQSWRDLGFTAGRLPIQLLVALAGFFLGMIDYSLLQPSPLIVTLSPENFIAPALILLVFTGFSEELIFRGIIQRNTDGIIGGYKSLIFTSLLFAAMHIGWNSLPDLCFVFFVGLFYGFIYQKTKTLSGITLSHGITNITMFLLLPFIA